MNTLTNEQYERVARYLDGEPLALTAPEAALADELQAGQKAMASLLPTTTPAGLTARVWQSVSARRSPLWRHVQYALCGVAAAAACVLVSLAAARWLAPAPTQAPAVNAPLPLSAGLAEAKMTGDPVSEMRDQLNRDLQSLEKSVASFQAPALPSDLDDDDASDTHSAPADEPAHG